MAVRVHIFVSGRVQGVFFRGSTKAKAQGLGLTGWVKNLDDGRVEAVFEGPMENVKEALLWTRFGPEGSMPEEIEVIWDEPIEGLDGFSIRY
jgi:acylphosphatase